MCSGCEAICAATGTDDTARQSSATPALFLRSVPHISQLITPGFYRKTASRPDPFPSPLRFCAASAAAAAPAAAAATAADSLSPMSISSVEYAGPPLGVLLLLLLPPVGLDVLTTAPPPKREGQQIRTDRPPHKLAWISTSSDSCSMLCGGMGKSREAAKGGRGGGIVLQRVNSIV